MIHGPQCHERAQAQKKTTTTAETRKVRCPHPFWGLSFFWRFWFWFPGVSNVMFMTRSPRSYDTKDCTRHQLHSLLYMGWRRIYFFDEIYGWYCARLNLMCWWWLMIWYDLICGWLGFYTDGHVFSHHYLLQYFIFIYIPFETFLPPSC